VFEAAAGRLLTMLPHGDGRHGSMVWTAAFSPDGRTLVMGSYHSEDVFVYDVATWRTVAKVPHGVNGGFSVAISGDGVWLATASHQALRLWRLGQYRSPIAEARISGLVWSIAFDPDGAALVTAGSQLERWRIVSEGDGRERLEPGGRAPIKAHTVIPVASRTGACFAAATSSALHLLCGDAFTEVLRVPIPAAAAAASPDGQHLVTAEPGGTTAAWPLDHGIDARRIPAGAPVRSIATARNHTWFAAGTEGATVVIFDAQTWNERARLPMPAAVERIGVSADGRWLVASGGVAVRVFDSSTWQRVANLEYPGPVTWAGFAPQQQLLVVIAGAEVVVLSPGDWRERFRLAHEGQIQRVAIDPDGARLATVTHWAGGHDSGVHLARVWDLASHRSLGWEYTSGGGSFSRQKMEELIARHGTSAAGGDMALVGQSSAWPALPLSEANEWASADGAWTVRASGNALTLSSTPAQREIGSWEQGSDITGIGFVPVASPRWLVSAGADGFLRLWPLTAGDLVSEACTRLRAILPAQTWTRLAGSTPAESCGPR
jgi:WD40 repeat protein